MRRRQYRTDNERSIRGGKSGNSRRAMERGMDKLLCHTVTLHIAPIAATESRSIGFPSGAAAQNSGAFWSTCRCSARSSAWTPKLGLIQLKPAITMRVTLKRARHSRQRSQIHRRPPRRGQKSAPPRSRCSPLTWRVRLGHLAHIQGFCFGVVVWPFALMSTSIPKMESKTL